MKKNDINHLLSGLLGEEVQQPPKPAPEPETKKAASEKSRQRVEEITRNVEIENTQNRPAPVKRVEQTIPKREPVPVPPPISHFSEEPSHNPAVRMRDRLDETALPMLDAERKPNQIIPPKPRPEQPKKKKKKRPQSAQNSSAAPMRSTDIPAPLSANPPKRRIPHIVVPDELPPDIPRDTSIADELRRRRQSEEMQTPEEPKPSAQDALAREQAVKSKAELIKERIRLSMEQEERAPEPIPEPQAEPEVREDREQAARSKAELIKERIRLSMEQEERAPEPIPEPQAEPEVQEDHGQAVRSKAELIKERIRLSMEQEAAPQQEMLPEPAEEPAEELPETPKKHGIGGFFQKKRRDQEEAADDFTAPDEPVSADEPEYEEEPPVSMEPEYEEAPAEEESDSEAESETEEAPENSEEPEHVDAPVVQAAPAAPRLRHLSAVDEPKEKAGLFGRFGSKKKQKLTSEPDASAKHTADKRLSKSTVREYDEIAAFFDEPQAPPAEQPAPVKSPDVPRWERSAVSEMPEESRRWSASAKPMTQEEPVVQEQPEEPAAQKAPEPPRMPEKPEVQKAPEPPRMPEKPVVQKAPEPPRMPEKPVVQKAPEPPRMPEKPVVQKAPEPPRVPEKPEVQKAPEPQEQEAQAVSIHVDLPEERRKSGFAAAIRAALDEDVQELADERAEPLPEKNALDVELGRSHYFRRRTYFMAGIICSALALVGIAACTMQAVQLVRNFTGSSSLKNELEDVLYPVAVVDLPDFEQSSDAAPETLLSAAMIDLLMYADLSVYPMSFDMISIPAKDVQNRAAEMFGTDLSDVYMTLYAAGEMFYYDGATGCFNVPASPVIFSYAPDIQEIRRADDVYTVTVDYRSDTAQWQQRSDNFDAVAKKTMEITLEQKDGDYRIVRIRNVSEHADGV